MAGRSSEPSSVDHVVARKALVRAIVAQVKRYGTGDGGKALDPRVIEALEAVPRERFVPMMEQADAYANRPLPIGHRQTISQPLIVALMTHHLHLQPASRVLEIGTGSGYQAAILARLAGDVVTVENVAALAAAARATLTDLGYRNIRFVEGDGRNGSPDHAPFDRIIVTAAADALPDALIDQLAPNGRLIAPVGGTSEQQLVLVTRDKAGNLRERRLFPVAFVPLTHGSDREA